VSVPEVPAGAPPGGDPGEEDFYEVSTVRPYARTGGRTRPSGDVLPIEALVSALAGPDGRQTAEKRRILQLSSDQYLSIAELSAHVHLPVGVVRVIVGDLVEEGLARVHGGSRDTTVTAAPDPATTLSVLESVLNGISAL
jgi:hypothetical protein